MEFRAWEEDISVPSSRGIERVSQKTIRYEKESLQTKDQRELTYPSEIERPARSSRAAAEGLEVAAPDDPAGAGLALMCV